MLIGVSGKLGSGKNEAFKSMLRVGSVMWERVEEKSFAMPIKWIVAIITNTSVTDQQTEEGKNMALFDLVDFKNESEEARKQKIIRIVGVMTDTKFENLLLSGSSNIHERTFIQIFDEVHRYYVKFLTQGELPETYATCGGLQQHVGTYTKQFYGDDIWVRTLFQHYDPQVHHWVIIDLRFPQEIAKILSYQGLVIRMEGDPKGVRARSKRDPNHISETALDGYKKWHAVIDNSKDDLNHLDRQIAKFIGEYNVIPI